MQTLSSPLPANIIKPPVRITAAGIKEVIPGTPFARIHKLLDNGYDICFTGTYGFAMSFYSWLKQRMAEKIPICGYHSSREHRHAWHRVQAKIWIRIKNASPSLAKAPNNPWLKDFFSGYDDFFITFSDFLGMNGARQWYEKGIRYPMVNHPIHPFYGVYFPTRHTHLTLFEQWMDSGKGFHRAADIGTGCGILSFIMHKHGVREIHATDINPNAIYSLQEDIQRLGISHGNYIFPEQADMLGSFLPGPEDLITFNPPWIPGKAENMLDKGCYYPPGFFERFFGELKKNCPSGTSITLLLSNFALVAGITKEHPIEEALKLFEKDFVLNDYNQRSVREKPSKAKSWIQSIRNKEKVELFAIRRR